jgi:hypothetical protein
LTTMASKMSAPLAPLGTPARSSASNL